MWRMVTRLDITALSEYSLQKALDPQKVRRYEKYHDKCEGDERHLWIHKVPKLKLKLRLIKSSYSKEY